MPRKVIVKPLEQVDVKRMIGYARKNLLIRERTAAANETSYGLGYYYSIA
jgi:hypothetical protein